MTRDLDAQLDRARSILADTLAEYRPVAVLAGFSGGYDSLVSTHFTLAHVRHAAAMHLNTGIGIEATRRFTRATAADRGWELFEEKTPESYEDMILGRHDAYPGGFPGPTMHDFMYQRLKERPLRLLAARLREANRRKGRERNWVLISTGIRSDEGKVRAGYKRAVSVDERNSLVWVNPLYWASHDHFREYRERHDLPANPVVSGSLGFSGECLCGAYAGGGELTRVRIVEPTTADYIEDLQRRAALAGFPWGYEDPGPPKWWKQSKRGQAFFDWHQSACGQAIGPADRPLCSNCERFQAVPAVEAMA